MALVGHRATRALRDTGLGVAGELVSARPRALHENETHTTTTTTQSETLPRGRRQVDGPGGLPAVRGDVPAGASRFGTTRAALVIWRRWSPMRDSA